MIERKIREIAGDQTLCYPYWNWSTDRHIPTAYARPGSALSNANRLVPNRAVDDGEVGYFPNDPVLKNLGVEALPAKIFEAKTRSDIRNSFGGIARPNPNKVYGNNRLESTPHGPIHDYVGGDMSDFEKMGSLQTLLPFKLAATDEALTAHGGLALVGEYVRAMGICSLMIMNCPAPAARRVITLPLMSCRWF